MSDNDFEIMLDYMKDMKGQARMVNINKGWKKKGWGLIFRVNI